ncbi:oligosaccharide repeat unit polymerase [Microbulbifer sp. TB1203]|uniref:oligosaccharide repeat unit polymerase n=1 Tax=Microbulbifer sp. TB1203 TaxID=3021712 RepID=UPI0027E5A6BB|nr:oligosaccharide repeat unit polymerase [Microbulbifer sp. TB1203]
MNVKVNRVGVALLLQAFFLPWLAFIVLRYLGPVTYPSVDGFSFLFLAIFMLPFFLLLPFLLVSKKVVVREVSGVWVSNPLAEGRGFSVVILLVFIYFFAVVLDKIVLSNVLTVGITEARYAAMVDGPRGSLLGAVHYLLAGAPVLLACLLLSRSRWQKGGVLEFCLWVLVVVCFASFFLSGGRNSYVVGVVFILFYFSLEKKRSVGGEGSEGGRNLRFPLWIKVFSVFGFFYVLYIFVERAEIRGTNLEGAVFALAKNYNVDVVVPEWIPGAFLQIYYCFLFLVFYVTHSLSYLSSYFELGYSPNIGGGYSFSVVFRIIDVLFGTSYVPDALDQLIIPGVYLTLPGTMYVDFGLFGAFLAGILLAFLSLVYVSRALRRGGWSLLAGAYLLTLLALSPIFSITNVGNGFSTLMIIIFLSFWNRRRSLSRSSARLLVSD